MVLRFWVEIGAESQIVHGNRIVDGSSEKSNPLQQILYLGTEFSFTDGVNDWVTDRADRKETRGKQGWQGGRVVSVLDFESVGPGFESHSEHFMDLFLGCPEL